jgi:hypothetical protein
VVILDSIVVLLAFILNPIAKRRRARDAAATGVVPDDPEANGEVVIASPRAVHAPDQAGQRAGGNHAEKGKVPQIPE